MRKVVLCVLVCVVCAFCVGAEVQEVSKAGLAKVAPYVEVWSVRETRRWTYDDGGRWNERLAYDLYVHMDTFGDVDYVDAWDGGVLLWTAWPPLPRLWNYFTERRPYVCFGGDYLEPGTFGRVVVQLKINRKWLKANGKITGAINLWGWNAYLDGRVRAEYLYTL